MALYLDGACPWRMTPSSVAVCRRFKDGSQILPPLASAASKSKGEGSFMLASHGAQKQKVRRGFLKRERVSSPSRVLLVGRMYLPFLGAVKVDY